MFALLNADREGNRRAAILLRIADCAENCSVETQMFGHVDSETSHWIEYVMHNAAAATKIDWPGIRAETAITPDFSIDPVNGVDPVSIWYATTPTEYWSEAGVTASARNCSGLM